MQRLNVDELKPSMVLAETIKDGNGNILFIRDTQLTEKHISILINRDIKTVSVEGDPVEKDPGKTEELSKEIDRRFSTAGPHPVVLKIKETLKELLT